MLEVMEGQGEDTDGSLSRGSWLRRRCNAHEIAGAFGDLGTFVPLFVALGQQRAIYVTPAIFMSGLVNLLNGLWFDYPMPVQPMKTIAAFAITNVLSREQVTAAGIWMGIFLLLLACSNGIDLVHRCVPSSVVSGMQIGIGISLAMHGIQMIGSLPAFNWPDCIVGAVFIGLSSLYLMKKSQPAGIYLVVIGVFLACFQIRISASTWKFQSIFIWAVPNISKEDWLQGLWHGAIPQLPLTTLNSVISLCCLVESLYPERRTSINNEATTLSRSEVCFSVGAMNILLCPFGAMPNCHGAGGLAGQHKFGARYGASIVFLGLLKMGLSLLTGNWLLDMLDAIPLSVLGIMLFIAGQELATTGLCELAKVAHRNPPFVESLRLNALPCLLTAAFTIMKMTHYGVVAGCLVSYLFGSPNSETRDYSHVPREIELQESEHDSKV